LYGWATPRLDSNALRFYVIRVIKLVHFHGGKWQDARTAQ
jgi:hypothetical protein